MKVLTVSIYSGGHGAYERQRRMARALMRAGHEVFWAAPGLDHPHGEILLPVARRSPLPSWLGWVHDVLRALKAEEIRLAAVDVVYVVNEYDALACLLSSALVGKPVVFFQRGDTLEVERFHARHAASLVRRLKSRLLALYYPILQRFLMKRLSGVVVQAPFLADILKRRHAALPPIELLPNDTTIAWHAEPVAPEQEERMRAVRGSAAFLVGLVAQAFWRGKGFDVFFDAMERLKDIDGLKAVIIGYGPEEHLIEKAIAERGLSDRVVWLGRSGAAHTLMGSFDLLVVPTVFLDACPNVVLEGLESEVAVLASDIPAHRAQLLEEPLMVPAGDAEAMAAGIRRLATDRGAWEHNRDLVRLRKDALAFDWDARVVEIVDGVAKRAR